MEQSRSVLRRQAIQRGEPAPTFGTRKCRVTLTFKRGPTISATVIGFAREIDNIAQEDSANVIDRIIELEYLLERLTGYRVHINVEEDRDK